MITREHAQAIASKLKARIKTNKKAHDLAIIEHDGVRIAQFGIRRGSRKSLGHDFIRHDLYIGPHETLQLAQCPMSREDWLKVMAEKGLIRKAQT